MTFLRGLPHAGHQAWLEAGTQRTLYAVACMPSVRRNPHLSIEPHLTRDRLVQLSVCMEQA
jgi:hypothetical protein